MWLRDPEKARVESNPRAGSLIYSTRPHDTARGCCCISDTAVFRGRAGVPGREFPRVTLGTIFDLFRSSHTKGLKSSQTAVDLGDLTGGTMLMVRSSPESNWQPLAPRRRGVAT